jgi:hypothetical protein
MLVNKYQQQRPRQKANPLDPKGVLSSRDLKITPFLRATTYMVKG